MKHSYKELNYDKIFAYALRMRLWYGRLFVIDCVTFYLVTMDGPTNDEDAWDAFYSSSTYIHGYDIYLNTIAKKEIVRRWLFHEIVEILWRARGKDCPSAHALALEQEEKYFGKRIEMKTG